MQDTVSSRQRRDHQLLQESLNLVAPRATDLISAFYDRLFTDYPQVRSMFPAVMDAQREKLLKAVIALVTHYDHPEALLPALTSMGRSHTRYGAGLGHYAVVGNTLLATLREFAGDAWNEEYELAWLRAYTFAAGTMMAAAAAADDASTGDVPATA